MRDSLYSQILGSEQLVKDILYVMQTYASVGMVYPVPFHAVTKFIDIAGNKEYFLRLTSLFGVDNPFESIEDDALLIYPVGDMFWARTAAVRQLIEYEIQEEDVPLEEGQIDGTILHAIERFWSYLAMHNGYRTVLIYSAEWLEKENVQLHRKCDELYGKLDVIYHSQIYKLMVKISKISDKLLPHGSVRRRMVRALCELMSAPER